MSKNSLNTYGEYRIKEVNGIRQFNKDGSPVLEQEKKIKRLSAETVKLLNNNSANFGKVYILEEEIKLSNTTTKTETVTETVIEIMEPEQKSKLDELREEAKKLGIKSAHNMKEETLIEKIKEVSK